jgi:predicted amidohydrolase
MKRRAFLKNSVMSVTGLAGMTYAGLATGIADGMSEAKAEEQVKAEEQAKAGDQVGRPVRITTISFPKGMPLDEIAEQVDKAGSANVDVIALPELCRGQDDKSQEDLHGPTVTAMAALAKRHQTYIVCPIDRRDRNLRLNTVVLLDRSGRVACTYDKVFPYWLEYDVHPSTDVGQHLQVYHADFGLLGFATCFDVNFPELWKRLADKGAEVVIWPSAYPAGTSLQAHAINHHFYVVSVTKTSDCIAYDITGEKLSYKKSEKINVATLTFDLDRGIYHQNFNIDKRDKLLTEHPEDVEQEKWMELERWFVLRAKRPRVSARQLAKQYGLEELRHYLDRSRRSIDERRGWRYEAEVLFPDLDLARLNALSYRGEIAPSSGTTS